MASWSFGAWTTLDKLDAGNLFETREGQRLLKTAYPVGRFQKKPSETMMICFQLENGEDYFCPNSCEVRKLVLE